MRAGRVKNGDALGLCSLLTDTDHNHHTARAGVGDEGENAILDAQTIPGQGLDLGFETNVGRHAQHDQSARLLVAQGIVGNQTFGVDLQAVVLRNGRQALHAGMEKRGLRAHGALPCCRKADKTAPTRRTGQEKSSVCRQCDVIKPLSVSAYSQGEKDLQRKNQLVRAIYGDKQVSSQLAAKAVARKPLDFGLWTLACLD